MHLKDKPEELQAALLKGLKETQEERRRLREAYEAKVSPSVNETPLKED
jgi:TRAP-type C4-dicarboxylate transport system substrate-binding protein